MRIATLAVLSLMLGATHAVAQHANATAAEKTLAAPANLTFGTVAGVLSSTAAELEKAGNPGLAVPTSALQILLDATNDKKVGTVAIGWKNGQQSHLLLTLSGPVDESSGEATPASLDGLANGSQAKLSFNRLNWRGPSGLEQLALRDDVCPKLIAKYGGECDTNNAKIPALEREALADLLHLNDIPWLIGGDVSVGRSGFKFLEPDTLAAQSWSKESFSATGRVGLYVPALGFVFGSYSYKRGYSAAGPASNICQPLPNTNATKCQTAVIGEPTEKKRHVASLEVRKFFAGPVATTPSFQFDLENDVRIVDVPIYFMRTAGSLTGGIRFNWRSDTKETQAVVFIGTAIGLLPQ